MALLSRGDYHFRQTNKEPEWSSICNDVFDQYLDQDDIFAFDAGQWGRTSSNDSCNLFDYSGSSEQSHQTDATSPMPSWEPAGSEFEVEVEKQHPKPKAPVDFWQRTVKALEQNAAECELKLQKLWSAKSHPDFLSLGGHPSPPAAPSPTDQSCSAQRRISRNIAANGKKRNITARSVSRGRPSGVCKATVAGSVNPYATVRKCSASPAKNMTNPSRYRAGFKDVWSEKLHASPEKYGIRVPSSNIPFSPPPLGIVPDDDHFAVFGSPTGAYSSFAGYDEQLSPLATTFQQAHIHTPIASPAINHNVAAHAHNGYFDAIPPVPPHPHTPQKVPLNDTAPSFPERTTSLAPHKIQDFDFGFNTSNEPDPFSPCSFGGPLDSNYATSQTWNSDPFGGIDSSVLPMTEPIDFGGPGSGISCDPSLVSQPFGRLAETATKQPQTLSHRHYPGESVPAAHFPYGQQHPPHGLPITPRRGRTHSRHPPRARSPSPSPGPATEPRSSKRMPRHRRTKSATSTPRHDKGGGFVNYTPHDSNKILSGVAPSGSSKTKARREKEAAEKRRRLSQAAMKAVADAGGDPSILEREGGLIM